MVDKNSPNFHLLIKIGSNKSDEKKENKIQYFPRVAWFFGKLEPGRSICKVLLYLTDC